MDESCGSKLKERITKINNALLLNTSFIDKLGLMHGKMGICIYFFHLARDTSNLIYEDYAEELIDEIFEEINTSTPLDFENGLAGIGWGIEYLVQNSFVEADTDEVLGAIEYQLYRQLIYNTPTEIGLLNGLLGIGAYFLKRLQNSNSNDDKLKTLTNKQSLIHLIDKLNDLTINITSLVREPYTPSLPNTENSNTQETEPKKQKFDLVWDYPVLIYFLAELHEQDIFNYKVELILERLLKPLAQEENWPQLHSNRLLLSMVIEKWKNSKLIIHVNENHKNILADIRKAKPEINRVSIKNELLSTNPTMRYGSSGISWLYKQLHNICNTETYPGEAHYWQDLSFTLDETNTAYTGFTFKNKNTAFGSLEGMIGIAL